MLSRELWRTLAEADSQDPIFRRVSQMRKPANQAKRGFPPPLWLQLTALIALVTAVVLSPSLLTLAFALPIVLITLMVAAPLLLPIITLLAGFHLTADVISGICQEKHQRTYDLICTLTQGTLSASWSCAIGITHRGGWYAPLCWGTLASFRVGLAGWGGLSLFTVLAAAGGQALGLEQVRLLLLLVLLLALYYSNMTQSLVMSLIIALLASSFEWSKPDATGFGLFVYFLLTALPLSAVGLLLFAAGRLVVEPAPALWLAVESAALLLVMALRELLIALLWRGLRRRMGGKQGENTLLFQPLLASY